MVAQILKRAGKRTWRPERVVRATGGGGAAGGDTAGVEGGGGGPAASLIQHVGRLDPVMGLLRTRSCSVFSP
jgi:hypothetical protein